jgi:hypothetical protein
MAVQKLMQRSCTSAAGTLQSGQLTKDARWKKAGPSWLESKDVQGAEQ